ncbi:uncharacterized protein [Cherax quadricarinatus]|uniref:uncharacterized protein n=1 Tax=Cherax quadricarinatus TaxID=27406 RepID=UPI00387EA62B
MSSSQVSDESDVLDGPSSCSMRDIVPAQRSCESLNTNPSVQQREDVSVEERTSFNGLILSVPTTQDTSSPEITVAPGRDFNNDSVSNIGSRYCRVVVSYGGVPPQALALLPKGRKISKRVCYHRSYLKLNGPPCYLCSSSDLPPKYTREESKWQRGKKRFRSLMQDFANLDFSRGLQTSTDSRDNEGYALPCALSNGTLARNINLPAYTPYMISGSPGLRMSSIETEEQRASSLDDIPEIHGHPNSSYQENNQISASLGSHSDHIHNSEITVSPHSPTTDVINPSEQVPPPYSPPTPGCLPSGYFLEHPQQQPRQRVQNISIIRSFRCKKSCIYIVVYSFLLAYVSSMSLVGHNQPVAFLAILVIFLALFVFTPIIWFLESLLCWRPQDFRNTDNSMMREVAFSTPIMTPVFV